MLVTWAKKMALDKENRLDSTYILQIETIKLPNGLEIGNEGKGNQD